MRMVHGAELAIVRFARSNFELAVFAMGRWRYDLSGRYQAARGHERA
jgi:hypothetical protein